ncbi:MAG TPA: adenylate/guanylate cyclase domain-containing protein [Urbifossiella sp.]|jgi:class 3 adenylate cyclase|nr:adenylate/guanylate cyclase domain-containing protein [Urbifossiella sp.]
MAELEAITDIRPTKDKPHVAPAQFTRRFPLAGGKQFRLGRDESKMDFAVPEDDQVSRYYANVSYEGARVRVDRRPPVPPDYPDAPVNKIVVRDPKARDRFLDVTGWDVSPGESFWIGQTQFTLRGDNDSGPESPIDATVAARQEERTRAQLEEIAFTNPATVLKAMEQLPNTIRAAVNEQGLFRQMLRVIMEALPRADAAGIVRIPPDCPPGERRLAVVEANVRPTAALGGGFAPSRRLAHKAILERKRSCLHCWSTDPTDSGTAQEMTLASPQGMMNQTPWAVCTPFQDNSKFALYVSGRVSGQWTALGKPGQDKVVADLTQYQKTAELIVGLIETTLRMNRLAKQNSVIKQAWHRELWPFMDRPEELERVLEPQVKEVTILFCDLRGYSTLVSKNKDELIPAWRNISLALETMSSTVTDHGGVVSGFRGDAVLGFWGWPEPKDRQVDMAAQAAFRIWDKLTRKGMNCGLGVTHGPTLAGRLGAHDLAVVDLYGPVVNLAFRLEAMTKAFGVGAIVSRPVADRLNRAGPFGDKIRARRLGHVIAKGFPEPVEAFELYSTDAPPIQEYQESEWDHALSEFEDGAWAEAYRLLEELFPEDPASQCLRRVMNKLGTGDEVIAPPPDWAAHRSYVPIEP